MPTRLLLIRHGETAWSQERRHTGVTDIPLTEAGEAQARRLGSQLPAVTDVSAVWTSPLARATETARLAGLQVTDVDPDLAEWNYGSAEGRTTAEIREGHPGWDVWTHGVDDSESVDQVGARADRVIARARQLEGTVVLVSHAHLLRILAARWLGMRATAGRHLMIDPAAWCLLSWERETPAIQHWNIGTT